MIPVECNGPRALGAWLRRYRPISAPRIRLICFPYAGGSAGLFRGWPGALPDDVELISVQYPGRQDRFGEPCLDDMASLADRVTEALLPLCDRPFALFGHSMGAAVAYEVAVRLEVRRQVRPCHLFVSGHASPLASGNRRNLHLRDEKGMVDGLRELGGMDDAVLADPELLRLVVPYLRADLRLIETYHLAVPLPVSGPLTAYTGEADPYVTAEAVADWRNFTSAEFNVRTFPGGHLYLIGRENDVAGDVGQRLAAVR